MRVEFSDSPPARMRTEGSSSKFPGRDKIVSVSVTRMALASEVTSLNFIPNLAFSYLRIENNKRMERESSSRSWCFLVHEDQKKVNASSVGVWGVL